MGRDCEVVTVEGVKEGTTHSSFQSADSQHSTLTVHCTLTVLYTFTGQTSCTHAEFLHIPTKKVI